MSCHLLIIFFLEKNLRIDFIQGFLLKIITSSKEAALNLSKTDMKVITEIHVDIF